MRRYIFLFLMMLLGVFVCAGTYINGVEILNTLSITETTSGTTILPVGGITKIGDAASTSHALSANDDLYVSGKLESDGVFYADGDIVTNNIFKDSTYGYISLKSQWQTLYQTSLLTGSLARSILIAEFLDGNTNFAHAQQADPTVWVQASDAANIKKYLGFWHDGDDVTLTSGRGGYSFEVPAQHAEGTMTLTGIPTADETFVINATTITAKADGSGNIDHFTIGADAAETVTNIVATLAECSEAANLTAWDGAGDTVVIQWDTAGTAGNSIVFTEALSNATVDGSGTLGGTHAGVAAGAPLVVNESTGTTILNGLNLPHGTTPAPDVLGSLFYDTDAGGGDGSLMLYTASGWETVKDFN